MNPSVVREQARDLVARSVWFSERILVLGATGWFGSTMLALLADHPAAVLPVASRARVAEIAGRDWPVSDYDMNSIVEFAPTIVLDFAYLNRHRERDLGPLEYRRRLFDLTDRFGQVARLPSVRAVVTTSSGAAVCAPEGPHAPLGGYGEQKRRLEDVAGSLVDASRSVLVARAYSVSGALVDRPQDYAFSDLIGQARTGRIEVRAPGQVWRRYCGVDDYLAVCLAEVMAGRSGTIESGGPLVELRDLAGRIAERFPGDRPRVVAIDPDGSTLRYASDDSDWVGACARQDHIPATLDEQIDAVQAWLGRPAAASDQPRSPA